MQKLTKPILFAAIIVSLAVPIPADASSQRTKNTVGGAAIGAGVGYLVGGSDGAKAGAVVGAISGYTKKTKKKK